MLQSPRRKRGFGGSGGTTIQAPGRVPGPGASATGEPSALEPTFPREPRAAIEAWAARLVAEVARDQPAQHVAVFVPDAAAGGLRLVAQNWGAGEDTGEVVVGEWIVPFSASVCGRVYRTGAAALCADVALDPDYRPFPGGKSRSSLTVPVGKLGAVVAVVNVEAPWVGAFSVRDHDHVSAAASAAVESFPA
jgi:GAF domain